MKKIGMLKLAGGIIISVGVGAIAGNAIKIVTPTSIGIVKKICIAVGATVLTSMASDKATTYAEEKITEVIDMVKELKETEGTES